MLSISDRDKKESVLSMLQAIHTQQEQYDLLYNSKWNRIQNNISRMLHSMNPKKINNIKGFILDKYSRYMIKRKVKPRITHNEITSYSEDEFFSDDRIAIYTSIFGNYESIHEPQIIPDNVDYYIITDGKLINNSRWKVLHVDLPPGLNSAQKNRYVKMHPHLFLSGYRYSIYVDGSIQILSDLTPLIHRIGKYGFAMHLHSARDDLYDELTAAKYTKRITKKDFQKYTKLFKEQNMPPNYGLVECGIIAREHANKLCLSVMEQWWESYLNGINRDQICLAYVLYKNRIPVKDIGTLGSNMYHSYLFKILVHK